MIALIWTNNLSAERKRESTGFIEKPRDLPRARPCSLQQQANK